MIIVFEIYIFEMLYNINIIEISLKKKNTQKKENNLNFFLYQNNKKNFGYIINNCNDNIHKIKNKYTWKYQIINICYYEFTKNNAYSSNIFANQI